jgi:hypothetical protein
MGTGEEKAVRLEAGRGVPRNQHVWACREY